MTGIRVRQLSVIRRLYDRYKLDPAAAGVTTLNTEIVPVTNVDELLASSICVQDTLDLTGAAGSYVLARTCPTGKKWRLRRVFIEAPTGGTSLRLSVGADTNIQMSPSISTDNYTDNLGGLVLVEGDSYGEAGTGNGADSARVIHMFYNEEDAR